MNRFDDEDKIISQFQEVNDNEVMFATQSETIESVYLSIHTKALWSNWINSSGKSDPPPDYYSPQDELMMDVMRVDDHAFVDKKGKIQNPTNAGWFKNVKGFLIGRPLCYGQEMMGLDQYSAVTGIAAKYNVPVIMDCDFGHLSPSMPIVSGAYTQVKVKDNDLSLNYRFC